MQLLHARAGHNATTLSDGRIAIAGGDASGSVEIIDPSTMTMTAEGSLPTARSLHGAALLSDGTVLLAGGVAPDGTQIKWFRPLWPSHVEQIMKGVRAIQAEWYDWGKRGASVKAARRGWQMVK